MATGWPCALAAGAAAAGGATVVAVPVLTAAGLRAVRRAAPRAYGRR
jgi:hypothetical protein